MNADTCLFCYIVLLLFVPFHIVSSETCTAGLVPAGPPLDIFHHLTEPCRYNKWRRPNPQEKTVVFVHIHVYSIVSIDAQHLQYTIQILLRYRWTDTRLKQASILRHEGELSDRIWSPHLYVTNEQFSTVMGSPLKDTMNSIWPDGTIVSLSRMKITLRCAMDLQKFPFDSQYCPLIMESWSYNTSQLELAWEEDSPITVDSQLHLPEYLLVNVITNSSAVNYNQRTKASTDESVNLYYGKGGGNFSTLTVYFALKRLYGFYIMDYYVPSILIVVVSWVTFWLDANSTPGRTIIGTSTLLTFITLSRNIGSSLPKVSYIKSSEIWYLGCIGFLFSSLAEFAFVNVIWRRKKDVNLKKVTGKHILQSTLSPQTYHKQIGLTSSRSLPSMSSQFVSSEPEINGGYSLERMSQNFSPSTYVQEGISTITLPVPNINEDISPKTLFTMTPQEIANWLDRKSRLFFPIAFVIFNCAYWTWTLVLF